VEYAKPDTIESAQNFVSKNLQPATAWLRPSFSLWSTNSLLCDCCSIWS